MNRFSLHKLVDASGSPARLVLEALSRELSELLLACAVEVAQPWMTSPLTDITTVPDAHLHYLRPVLNDQW